MKSWIEENLVCPRDLEGLRVKGDTVACEADHRYPYIDEIPIMLLEETEPTHEVRWRTLDVETSSVHHPFDNPACNADGPVDPYVQKMIAATCGIMYKPLIGKLTRYPIPELPLPKGSGQMLLDLGCNWGRWCLSAAREGYDVVGIDPSLEAIRAARRVAAQLDSPGRYIVADARYLPFKPESFDVVFSYSVLQHFDKREAIRSLAEIGRVLTVRGFCLIQMPGAFGVRNLYNQLRRRFREAKAFEVRYWRLGELVEVFNSVIGPTSLRAEGYLSLGAQGRDLDILPRRFRLIVTMSEMLRRLSERLAGLEYFADSVYVRASSNKDPNAFF